MQRVIECAEATNVLELIDALKSMMIMAQSCSSSAVADPATVYVTIDSEPVSLGLVEETLTDGSIVYNIKLYPAT